MDSVRTMMAVSRALKGEEVLSPARLSRRRKRRFRKIIRVVLFCCWVERVLQERRWGQHVEEHENMLLETSHKDLPSSYFEAMGNLPLPPGWNVSSLPVKVQHQIRTYAKNKLVRLLTPIARLRSLKIQLRSIKNQYVEDGGGKISPADLKNASPFFEIWSEGALNELLSLSKVRAYRSGMWVHPISAATNVGAFVVLAGEVTEVTRTNGNIAIVADRSPVTVLLESKVILSTPTCVGLIAKDTCIVQDIDCRDILRISFRNSAMNAALRRFVVSARSSQMHQLFPLTLDNLKKMPLFARWDENDLLHLISTATTRISFDGEELCTQGSAVSEVVIVCRGAVNIKINGVHRKSLHRLESFGDDAMVFEEKCPATLISEGFTETWHISRQAVFSHLKSTVLKKAVASSAVDLRVAFMESVRDRDYLSQRLRDAPEFSGVFMPEECLYLLERKLKAAMFAAGDRFVTGGDELDKLFILETGRVVAKSAESPIHYNPPCIIGGKFLTGIKWASSMMAARNTECWILTATDAKEVLRDFPQVMRGMQRAKSHRPSQMMLTSMLSAVNLRSTQREAAGRQSVSFNPTFRSDQRAVTRKAIKERLKREEEEEEVEKERLAARERARVAPPPTKHISMSEYEGLKPVMPAPKSVYDGVREDRTRRPPPPPPDEVEIRDKSSSKGLRLLTDNSKMLEECRPRVQNALAQETRRLETREALKLASEASEQAVLSMTLTAESGMSLSTGGGTGNSEGSQPLVPAPPTSQPPPVSGPVGGTAEKNVFKGIIRRHKQQVAEQRAKCAKEASIATVVERNPFSNFKRRRQPIQRMTPLGELYIVSPVTKSSKAFDPKTYEKVIPASYVSAHGFSDLDVYSD